MIKIKRRLLSYPILDWLILSSPILCGILAFILYESTNSEGLFWGDSGEFISVAKVLGIGHPYGHPLFWLVGRLAILLNPSHPAFAMNQITALFSALTCVVIAMIVQQFIPQQVSKLSQLFITIIVTIRGSYMSERKKRAISTSMQS